MTAVTTLDVRGGDANRLKLGLFSLNLLRGSSMSDAPGTLPLEWPHIRGLAREADELGLEFLVPVARWRGWGGTTNFGGTCFDTLCWAAGLAEATERIGIMSTIHVPTIHPLVAAKQMATIDHISGGRSALNIVGGWFRPELEMFGSPMLEHDRRYELAEEWTTILKHLWTEDAPLDFQGEFFTVNDAVSSPKPLQRPCPPIMNAGGSPRGQRFAAEYADMVFVFAAGGIEGAAEQVARYKDLARSEFGRELEVWTQVTVTCYEDEAKARAIEAEVLEHGDFEAVDYQLSIMGLESGVFGEAAWQDFREKFVTGWGAPQLTGTSEAVAESLTQLSAAGFDGCLLTFPRWGDGLTALRDGILPRLEKAGLRMPADALVAGAR